MASSPSHRAAVNATAPAFTSATATIFTAGIPGSFQITTTGSPAPTVTTSSLPPSVSFDGTTDTLYYSGAPGPPGGSFSLTLFANNGVGPSVLQSLNLLFAKQDQSIIWGPLMDLDFGAAPFDIEMKATSGLHPVGLRSMDNSVCMVTNQVRDYDKDVERYTVVIVGAGTCTLDGSQMGDSFYNPKGEKATFYVRPIIHFGAESLTLNGPLNITLIGNPACTFSLTRILRTPPGASPVPPTVPGGVYFPYGLFEYRTVGCQKSVHPSIVISLPTALPANAQLWRYGQTSNTSGPHWYTVTPQINANLISFRPEDGGALDGGWGAGAPGGVIGIGIPIAKHRASHH